MQPNDDLVQAGSSYSGTPHPAQPGNSQPVNNGQELPDHKPTPPILDPDTGFFLPRDKRPIAPPRAPPGPAIEPPDIRDLEENQLSQGQHQ